MKLPRLPVNFDLIRTFERAKKFALVKMSELKRSLEDAEPAVEQPAKKIRIKNRKFALLLCYSGRGYYGLQR